MSLSFDAAARHGLAGKDRKDGGEENEEVASVFTNSKSHAEKLAASVTFSPDLPTGMHFVPEMLQQSLFVPELSEQARQLNEAAVPSGLEHWPGWNYAPPVSSQQSGIQNWPGWNDEIISFSRNHSVNSDCLPAVGLFEDCIFTTDVSINDPEPVLMSITDVSVADEVIVHGVSPGDMLTTVVENAYTTNTSASHTINNPLEMHAEHAGSGPVASESLCSPGEFLLPRDPLCLQRGAPPPPPPAALLPQKQVSSSNSTALTFGIGIQFEYDAPSGTLCKFAPVTCKCLHLCVLMLQEESPKCFASSSMSAAGRCAEPLPSHYIILPMCEC